MKKIKYILDFLFLYFAIFLFVVCWCNFYLKTIKNSILFSILIASALMLILFITINFFKNKNVVKKQERNFKEKLKNNLCLMAKSQQIKLIDQVCKKPDHFIYYNFLKQEINEDDIKQTISNMCEKKQKNAIIFCLKCSLFAKNFAKKIENFSIQIIEYDDFYNLLKQKNILPQNLIEIKQQKITYKMFFQIMFDENRSKQFFWIGLFLAFSCLFTPFKIYYAISASIFILFAILCKFKGKFKQTTEQN